MQEIQPMEQAQVVGYGVRVLVIVLLATLMGSIIYVVFTSY